MFDLGGIVHRVLTCVAGLGGSVDNSLKKLSDLSGIDLDADVLSWMHGEAVAVVGPALGAGKAPTFGLLVAPSDQAKAAAALAKLRTTFAEHGVGLTEQSIGGATAYVFESPISDGVQPAMALLPGRFILASNPGYLAELIAHPGMLAATDDYRSVIGTGNADNAAFQLVIRISPIRDAIAGSLTGAAAAGYKRDVAPYVTALKAIGVRTWQTGTTGHVEVTIAFH
jgi:hypothetical protein